MKGLVEKKGANRKIIRYLRWTAKVAFLIIFVIPIAGLAGAPALPLYSGVYDGLNQPLLTLPYGQSPCTVWLVAYGYVGPLAWIICPVGGLQVLISGRTDFGVQLIIPTILAILVFLVPIFLLGNVFCGWICPVGTMIDGFDDAVAKYAPRLNAKREDRALRDREKSGNRSASKPNGSHLHGSFVCPSCPFGRLIKNKHATSVNGVLAITLVGSAVFRFNVFCGICPIGISTRGMLHLKALTNITGRMMPIIAELWVIPLIAVLLSLRQKRYFCRKICPVGASLNLTAAFNPFFKPTVKADKCIMYGCPKDCEDYHLDYCSACRQMDQKRCEKVCPQGINLIDKGSLAKCTKCLECYIQCERDAIDIAFFETPDAISAFCRFKEWLRKQRRKTAVEEPQSILGTA